METRETTDGSAELKFHSPPAASHARTRYRSSKNSELEASPIEEGKMRGMVAGTCHKLDGERSLWTVVMIGVSESREIVRSPP